VFVLSCVGSGLAAGSSSAQGVLTIVCKIRNFKLILNENRPEGLIRQTKERNEIERINLIIFGRY
jgi:hypothetical protein